MLYLKWLWRDLFHKNFHFTYEQWLRCRKECNPIVEQLDEKRALLLACEARRMYRQLKKAEHTPETHVLYVGGIIADMMFAMIDHTDEYRRTLSKFAKYPEEDCYKGFKVISDDNIVMEFRKK